MCLVAKRGHKEYWDALENDHLIKQKSDDLKVISQTDGLRAMLILRRWRQC